MCVTCTPAALAAARNALCLRGGTAITGVGYLEMTGYAQPMTLEPK